MRPESKQNKKKYSLIPAFESLIEVMAQNRLYEQVFIEAEKDYDIKCFKFNSSFSPKTAATVWKELQTKRSSDLQSTRPCNWQQNQRRLFVWFVICYCFVEKMTISQLTEQHYNELSEMFFYKEPIFLEYQCQVLIKKNSRCTWSIQEDNILTSLIEDHQSGKWNQIAKEMFFRSRRKLFRTPKQCRQRWFNHLDKSKVKGEWDQVQDLKIVRFVKQNGKRWAKIVPILKNMRTEHMIKNRYKSILSKNGNLAHQTQRQIISRILTVIDSEQKSEEHSNSTTSNLNSPSCLQSINLFQENSQKMKKGVSYSTLTSTSNSFNSGFIFESFQFNEQLRADNHNQGKLINGFCSKQYSAMFNLLDTLILESKHISSNIVNSKNTQSFRLFSQQKSKPLINLSKSFFSDIEEDKIRFFQNQYTQIIPNKNIFRQVQIVQLNR